MDSGVATEELETDLEGDAEDDVLDDLSNSLDRFADSIRSLEERVTRIEQDSQQRNVEERLQQLEQENEELRTALNRLVEPFGSLDWAATAMEDISEQIETVPEDLQKIQEMLQNHHQSIKELKSFDQSSGEEKLKDRFIRGTWGSTEKCERRAEIVYLELLKKKKESFPDGRILKVLSKGEIIDILNEDDISQEYRDLSISTHSEAERVAERIRDFAQQDIFLADVYIDELRRKDRGGNKRMLECVVVEVVT